ncbi:hypothetical protein [Alkalicoccus chagannorensis]|uniref:hypothetical protein n=1 Tax=Alkalicoccus chagannorensis TaxID=427072 RepID=UPI0004024CB3|nr:hypothetical protein [Alkalicoccus chagannorensis]
MSMEQKRGILYAAALLMAAAGPAARVAGFPSVWFYVCSLAGVLLLLVMEKRIMTYIERNSRN